jgi:hypothetical protein
MEITTERLSLLHELQHHVGVNFLQINDLADLTLGSRSGTRVEVLLPLMEEA